MKIVASVISLIFLIQFGHIGVQAQSIIKGKVIDGISSEPLVLVNIIGSSGEIIAFTDESGIFELNGGHTFPLKITLSYIGYDTKKITVNSSQEIKIIRLYEDISMLDEIVISASRRPERVNDAPATISVINSTEIRKNPGTDLFHLLANVKGVDYHRKGVGTVGFNIRGFDSAFNPKNLLIIDSRISSLINSGVPFLQMTSFSKEDVDRMEIILGPSSALYGASASNGLINIITKDPRSHPGTNIVVGGGNQDVLSVRFRHANAISERLGFKLTGSYDEGRDFEFTDSVYYDPAPAAGLFADHGVAELDLDKKHQNIKGEIGLYYDLGNKNDIILNYGIVHSKMVETSNVGRIQFAGWANQYIQARFVSKNIFFNVSRFWNLTTNDDSQILSVITANNESYKSVALLTDNAITYSDEEAAKRALLTRWAGFLTSPPEADPNTHAHLVVNPNFKDQSSRTRAEIQYNERWQSFRLITGAQILSEAGGSKGTYLFEDENGKVKFTTIGAYAQVEHVFGESGWKAVGAARGDNHSAYGFNFSPKLALIKIQKNGAWRLTFGKGYTAPTIFNLEIIFAGGNLLGNSEGFTLSDGTVLEKLEVEKISTLELGYKGLITPKLFFDGSVFYNQHKDFIPSSLQPVTNVELGKFVTHRGDIPISEIQSPLFSVGVQAPALVALGVPANASLSTLTFVNFGEVQTYGLDLAMRYTFNRHFHGSFSYSYFESNIDEEDLENDFNGDGIVQKGIDIQINTPTHKLNVGAHYVRNKYFASLLGRWVAQYNYLAGINVSSETVPGVTYNGYPLIAESRVGTSYNPGPLGGFVNLDVNFGYEVTDNITLSTSITNALNTELREMVASPAIGRLVYAEFKYSF